MKIKLLLKNDTIKEVELEEYLRAVVPTEMPHTWPPETLKAQAVAARTYALSTIRINNILKREYDLIAGVSNQAYNESKINPLTDKSISQTRFQILAYNGKPIQAVYSSNCGGCTKNNEDVWGTPNNPVQIMPYLRSVKCPIVGEKYGHGVGLCQHGARALGEKGYTYMGILFYYYKGVTLEMSPKNFT